MKPLGQRLIEWAASQIGIAEDPAGSNDGPPLKLYGIPGEEPAPWCARFARTAYDIVGAPLPGNRWSMGAGKYLEGLFEQHGWLLRPGSTPEVGDLAFWFRRDARNPNGRHVAFVEATEGKELWTIGGNENNAVRRWRRRLDDPLLIGFGRRPDTPAE